MARKRRSLAVGISHHVMLRGIDGEPIFRTQDDYCRLCLMLQKASEQKQFRIHAFAFMQNHIHLMIEPLVEPLPHCVHSFAARYAQSYNRKYDRRGYLFQGRFRSIVVAEGTYVKRLLRYIHWNPVAAGIVCRPEQYRWTSHRAYMGLAVYEWLTRKYILQQFDHNNREAVAKLLIYTNRKSDIDLDRSEIDQAYLSGGYGDEAFLSQHVSRPSIDCRSILPPVSLDTDLG